MAIAAGVGAVVSSVGTTMLGLAAPAIGATTAPVCDASKTDAVVRAGLKSTNAKALAAYLKSKPYLALHTSTLKSKTAWTKAKGKAKVAALKKYKAAQVKEAAAIAAFKKANTYNSFSGKNTPTPINTTSPDHPGVWNWGDYYTRVIVKGGAVTDVCTFIDQTNDGSVTAGTPASDVDKTTSRDTYQGINAPFATSPIPGTLPVLWNATLAKPTKTQAAVEAHVNQCIHQSYTVLTAPCTKGGLVVDAMTGLTGATYTVQGYADSLHAALTAAKAAKSIG
jgi:hypothetical protein